MLAISDLHLPPQRTGDSARTCGVLAARLAAEPGPVTVVLAGDVIELLGFPQATAAEILREHETLCAALAAVTGRGGQVICAIGNHDNDLAWDIKTADAVREMTGARLCLAADLVLPSGRKIRVEHGHQLDPYNCFQDQRNSLDTPLGHHIVRQVLPRVEWLGRDWLDGAHEMADPADFPAFVGSRLFYRKLVRHAWWLVLLPVLLLLALRISEIFELQSRYPDTTRWVHGAEVLGYGAVADLVVVAVIIAIVSRRAWTAISELALAERGYGQNRAARQRAADLTGDGYRGFLSGHTHHPELVQAGLRFLRQHRIVHHGGRGDRHPARPAARVPAGAADHLGGDHRRSGHPDGRADPAARCDPAGTLRRVRPQPVLGHPRSGRRLGTRATQHRCRRLRCRRPRRPRPPIDSPT